MTWVSASLIAARRRNSEEGTVTVNSTPISMGLGRLVSIAGLSLTLLGVCGLIHGQDGPLYINEVLPENDSTPPADIGGGFTDMIELYNAGDTPILLGDPDPKKSYYLSETVEFGETASRIKIGTEIPPGGYVIIFCDGNALDGVCEPHASFGLESNGTEPVSLWGPAAGENDERPLLDQVWLPPLRSDVSFARIQDGVGPAPVPLEETFNVFQRIPAGQATLGECESTDEACAGALRFRECRGATNGEGGNLEPRVSRNAHSSNRPMADEPMVVVARVTDDKTPDQENITKVEIRYTVNGEARDPIPMQFEELLTGIDLVPPRPLSEWSLWTGTIPGLPAESRVQFELYVEDAEGLSSVSPRNQCPDDTGPCDSVGLPGPGCAFEKHPDGSEGPRYQTCDRRRQYVVGWEPQPPYSNLLINEVVSFQTNILLDRSEPACRDPLSACRYDDFIELCNTSDEAIDLAGLWLSDRPFHPQGWKFPPGSTIQPGQRLIVWTDDDGGKCPRPDEKIEGDAQDCPDPTDVAAGDFHTNFALDRAGDQIYIFQELEGGGFGTIHGLEFGRSQENFSFSLSPDCSRDGVFVPTASVTPGAPNADVGGSGFLRGDASADCDVNLTDATSILNFLFLSGPAPLCPDAGDVDDTGDINLTDAVYLLNYLFLEGPEPPAPGGTIPGVDPTSDELAPCSSNCSGG